MQEIFNLYYKKNFYKKQKNKFGFKKLLLSNN